MVVTDIGMPNLDGVSLARCLRNEALRDRDLRVIFITGRRGAEEPVRALRVGGFDLLNKPIRLGDLHQAVRRAAEAVRDARLERAAKAELRREIAEQRRNLAATTQVKDAFLPMMSHELRTPFNAIIGFSELLLDRPAGANDATAIESVGQILAAARHLQEQIDAILDLVAVQSETLELCKADERPKPFDVQDAVIGAMGLMGEQLRLRDIKVSTDIPKLRRKAIGHLVQLEQVVLNLLANARAAIDRHAGSPEDDAAA